MKKTEVKAGLQYTSFVDKEKEMKMENSAKEHAGLQYTSLVDKVGELLGAKTNEKRDTAARAITESVLSVEVRCGWHSLETPDEKPSEFQILLCWGGPGCRLIGGLNDHGEPERARLEYQDWGIPWTEYRETNEEILLEYCRQFFG